MAFQLGFLHIGTRLHEWLLKPIKVHNFAFPVNCTTVGRHRLHHGPFLSIYFRWRAPDYQCQCAGRSWFCLRLSVSLAGDLHWDMLSLASSQCLCITKTCLYNFDPLKPHFSIVKLGFTGVYIIFLTSAQKHRLWVLVGTASSRRFQRVPTIYVLSRNVKKYQIFLNRKFSFFGNKIFNIFQ